MSLTDECVDGILQSYKKREKQIASIVENVLEAINFKEYSARIRESLTYWNPDSISFNLIEYVLDHICLKERSGAILVFKIGCDDINSLKCQLEAHPLLGDSSKVLLLVCHGSMDSSEQRLIFNKFEGVRKIVLATNRAETSITINDVAFVVNYLKTVEESTNVLTLVEISHNKMIGALAKLNVDYTTYFEVFALCDPSQEDSFGVTAVKLVLIYQKFGCTTNGVVQERDGYVEELKPKPPDGNLSSKAIQATRANFKNGKDNVFIISNPKSKYPVLQLDLRLISDLVVVIVSTTFGGIAFACAGQPVIIGYLLAGSIIGPGGLSFVSERVQIETITQFGVIFLLCDLGLDFSAIRFRVVRAVAVLGDLFHIFLFMYLSRITTSLSGGQVSEGIFVGASLSMSSTTVVFKFLMERNNISTLYGQATIGTLILQDCTVGLLFALLLILGGSSGVLQGMMFMAKPLVILITFLAILSILCRTFTPWFLKLMISLSSQTNELYQLAAVALCLIVVWCSDKLEQVEPICNFFTALIQFFANIGMLIHVHFLWNYIGILLAVVILVILIKTAVVAAVAKETKNAMHDFHDVLNWFLDFYNGVVGAQHFMGDGGTTKDWEGINRIASPPHSDCTYSVEASILAGIDMVMVLLNYTEFIDNLTYLIKNNFIPMDHLDNVVGRILLVKFIFGLFENPLAELSLVDKVGNQLAREAVRKSFVLLKNGEHSNNLGYQCYKWTFNWQGFSGKTQVTAEYQNDSGVVVPNSVLEDKDF